MTLNVSAANSGTINQIENQLQQSLRLIEPRKEFVGKLQHRLVNEPRTVLEDQPFKVVYLIFAGALFIGMLLLWVLGRIWTYISRLTNGRKL